MYFRQQTFENSDNNSFFLWGARQTGKSTLLKYRYKNSLFFDLLMNDVYLRFLRNPSALREIILAEEPKEPVIIDEIQKIPALLDEIHWLIENTGTQFILSGSSPRKILKQGVNLLGGRALRYELYPLSSTEIPDFDLSKALNAGLIPRHYDATNYEILLAAYIGSYLEDEIIAETKIRNAQIFSRFLEKAAFSNGELLNYSNIASDCGVSSPVIKEYFNILNETMIGRFVESFRKKPKRRILSSPKFYFFDVGVVNHLLKRKHVVPGSESYGSAFEHFIYHEIATHSHYSGKNYPITFWRTISQLEVDFILGDHEVAVEVKSTDNVQPRHLKGLKAFSEEYEVKHKIVVSNDPYPRLIGDIRILPWQRFVQMLWGGEFI
jgi:predicted AAA+ superfamily ATPase